MRFLCRFGRPRSIGRQLASGRWIEPKPDTFYRRHQPGQRHSLVLPCRRLVQQGRQNLLITRECSFRRELSTVGQRRLPS